MPHTTFTVNAPDFRERLLQLAAKMPHGTCPFCDHLYIEGEYESMEFGYSMQVSPSYCPDCNAYQLGCYKMDLNKQVYLNGWVKDKLPGDEDKYPAPPEYIVKEALKDGDYDLFERIAEEVKIESSL